MRKGRNVSDVRSPRKFCDNRAGIPIRSLMVPSRRVLSVLLIPMVFGLGLATAGVLKPLGGRVVARNDRLGVTFVPPGWPRWSLCSYKRMLAPILNTWEPRMMLRL